MKQAADGASQTAVPAPAAAAAQEAAAAASHQQVCYAKGQAMLQIQLAIDQEAHAAAATARRTVMEKQDAVRYTAAAPYTHRQLLQP